MSAVCVCQQPFPIQVVTAVWGRTLPPSTSSPMMMHPAVCSERVLFSSGDIMILLRATDGLKDATEELGSLGSGRIRCRFNWAKRENMKTYVGLQCTIG